LSPRLVLLDLLGIVDLLIRLASLEESVLLKSESDDEIVVPQLEVLRNTRRGR